MIWSRTARIIAATALLLVGCVEQPVVKKSPTVVPYSGYFNTIDGQLSDGLKFSGIGWLKDGRRVGDFCIKSGDFVCSGKYGPSLALIIKGTMECSDGTTGEFVTERIREGDFITAQKSTASLSDGRTATATFGAFQQGKGTTICLR